MKYHKIGDILEVIFFIIAGAAPLVILILSVLNFRRDRTRLAIIALKALVALVIWTLLAFVIFFLDIGYLVAFEYAFMQGPPKELESPATAAIVIGGSFLIYALAGGGLIYWTTRRNWL